MTSRTVTRVIGSFSRSLEQDRGSRDRAIASIKEYTLIFASTGEYSQIYRQIGECLALLSRSTTRADNNACLFQQGRKGLQFDERKG